MKTWMLHDGERREVWPVAPDTLLFRLRCVVADTTGVEHAFASAGKDIAAGKTATAAGLTAAAAGQTAIAAGQTAAAAGLTAAAPAATESIGFGTSGNGGPDCRIQLWWWNREEASLPPHIAEMARVFEDEGLETWEARITTEGTARYLHYCFRLDRNGETVYLGREGHGAEQPDYPFSHLWTNRGDIYTAPEWSRGALFYQIFPERFCNGDTGNDPEGTVAWGDKPTRENFFGGDIAGIRQKLGHLASLSVDALYLNPIFASPSNHKYDTTDYYRIDPAFGDLDQFRELVREAHGLGIRIVLDGVFNHCGFGFAPFVDVWNQGDRSAHRDWFLPRAGFPLSREPLNYDCIGEFWPMPKLNYQCRAVRDFVLGVGAWWLRETGIDGWRLDVADEVEASFWVEFRLAMKAVNPQALLMAETWRPAREMLIGDRMDTVMNYPFRDALLDFAARERIDAGEFRRRLQRLDDLYPPAVRLSLYNLAGSHDTARALTECGGDRRRMKVLTALLMTWPGMPAIYAGDELGVSGDNDPDCRRTMPWDGGDQELLLWHRVLGRLRRGHAALRYGDCRPTVGSGRAFGFLRTFGADRVYVLVNAGASSCRVRLSFPGLDAADVRLVDLLDGTERDLWAGMQGETPAAPYGMPRSVSHGSPVADACAKGEKRLWIHDGDSMEIELDPYGTEVLGVLEWLPPSCLDKN